MSSSYDVLKRLKYSYFHNPGTEPLLYTTIGQALEEAAAKWGDRDAIISYYEKKSLTFKQVKEQVDQLAAGLLELGLKPGDRLALLGVNTVHWFLTMLAATKAGIIIAMLNPGHLPDELGYALKKVKPKAIVMDHKFKTQDYPQMLSELVPGMSSAPHGKPLRCPELPDLSFVIIASEEKLPGSYRWEDLFLSTKSSEIIEKIERNVQPDDPACIIFTSGTTGIPKAAVLTHFGIINNSNLMGKAMKKLHKKLFACLQVPFFHVVGVIHGIISVINNGNTTILPAPIFRKELTAEVLQKYKCEILYGTPTMYFDLINELKSLLPSTPGLADALANVKLVATGGNFVDLELINAMSETFTQAELCSACGMTETSCTWVLSLGEDSIEKKATTVGQVSEHVEVKIVDKEGKMVPFCHPGEAWVRSYGTFLEYWDDEEKTKETKTKEGWVKTGDIMILWEDGYVSIAGRIKDMIIRGGENILSAEIEKFLLKHPEIADAQVFGVSDRRMGEEIAACVILKPDSTSLTEEGLKEYCRGKISHFKIPRYVKFVDNYPRTAFGKVKKFLLRGMVEAELNGNQHE